MNTLYKKNYILCNIFTKLSLGSFIKIQFGKKKITYRAISRYSTIDFHSLVFKLNTYNGDPPVLDEFISRVNFETGRIFVEYPSDVSDINTAKIEADLLSRRFRRLFSNKSICEKCIHKFSFKLNGYCKEQYNAST